MNPRKNRNKGKNTERKVAKLLGGRRVGLLGKEDIEMHSFSVEVKHRKKFVALKWMDQASKNCVDYKIPLLVVHVENQRHGDDCVIMRLKDFQRLLDWFDGI